MAFTGNLDLISQESCCLLFIRTVMDTLLLMPSVLQLPQTGRVLSKHLHKWRALTFKYIRLHLIRFLWVPSSPQPHTKHTIESVDKIMLCRAPKKRRQNCVFLMQTCYLTKAADSLFLSNCRTEPHIKHANVVYHPKQLDFGLSQPDNKLLRKCLLKSSQEFFGK